MKLSTTCGMTLLSCMLLAQPSRAGDVTVDEVTVTKFQGGYRVTFSGKLCLSDIGGNYEKWAGANFQICKNGVVWKQVGVKSLTAPTLTAVGDYEATVVLLEDAGSENWTVSTTANYYVDKTPNKKQKHASLVFALP